MKIPIKRYEDDPTLPWTERYAKLLAHHEEETKFLIGVIKRVERLIPRWEDRHRKNAANADDYRYSGDYSKALSYSYIAEAYEACASSLKTRLGYDDR